MPRVSARDTDGHQAQSRLGRGRRPVHPVPAGALADAGQDSPRHAGGDGRGGGSQLPDHPQNPWHDGQLCDGPCVIRSTHHGNETAASHGRDPSAPPARQGHADQRRTDHPGPHGGGRRAGQGVRHTQRPQGRPDGAEDGRAGAAVLAECELPTRSQPAPGNQEVARVTTLAAPRVWQHTQPGEGERPYAMSCLAVAESNRRRPPVLLTAAERSAT